MSDEAKEKQSKKEHSARRELLSKGSSLAMLAGLLGGYGAFGFIAARFLYPARPREQRWMFVTEVARMEPGDSLLYEAPTGETVNVTRQGRDGGAEDFIALSSTCPHLGCLVQWEAQNDRYFCPCHNGIFDPSGKGVGGPPGDAGQSLSRYPLRVDGGLLFMEVPVTSLAEDRQGRGDGRIVDKVAGVHGAGHDPCLQARHSRCFSCDSRVGEG